MRKVTPKVRRHRLIKLARYLMNLPVEKSFNMRTWGFHRGKHKPTEHNYCGVSACALGHAAMIPEFKRAGLRMKWALDIESRKRVTHSADILYGDHMDADAGARFFGLSYEESRLFFGTTLDRIQVVEQLLHLANNTPATIPSPDRVFP